MKKLIKNFSHLISRYFFPFYNSKDIKLLIKKLENGEQSKRDVVMFVGGCVRNHLKFVKVKDIDIATIFTPDEIKKKLKNSEFKVIDTGLEHGSVTIVFKNSKFELTTLRKDLKTDGRYAEIQIIDNWIEDSKRRDFTINAIYLNKKGKIFDPQHGINDLNNNTVKFIGDPQTRIEEDFLRIIRYIRFSIQYNSNTENSTLKAIRLNISGIKKLSKERVLSELFKILKLENFFRIVDSKELIEIFNLIFPEFENVNRFKNFKFIQNHLKKTDILLLGILLIDKKNNHEYFSHKYKVPKKINENLILLSEKYKESKDDLDFFKKKLKVNYYKIGIENLKILYCLNLLDKKKITSKEVSFFQVIEKILIPKLPFDGKFLIKKGIKEGKKIGKILKEAEKFWIENNFNLSSEDFETIIKKNSSTN